MSQFVLNYVFAWLAVLLGLFLAGKFILRKLASKKNASQSVREVNKKMRKPHIWIGIAMSLVGLAHGIYSSDAVLSVNLGTIAWIVGLLCGVNYMIRKRISKQRHWLGYHRALALLLIGFTVWHVIDVGGIQIFNVFSLQQEMRRHQSDDPDDATSSPSSSSATVDGSSDVNSEDPAATKQSERSSETTSEALSEEGANNFGVILKDGTYIGVADGYLPGLTVEVTVKDNQVQTIEILSHNEQGAQFYGPPLAILPDAIIEEQSLDVDTITGATYTSVGLLNAVNDALSQAVVSGTLPPLQTVPSMPRRAH